MSMSDYPFSTVETVVSNDDGQDRQVVIRLLNGQTLTVSSWLDQWGIWWDMYFTQRDGTEEHWDFSTVMGEPSLPYALIDAILFCLFDTERLNEGMLHHRANELKALRDRITERIDYIDALDKHREG